MAWADKKKAVTVLGKTMRYVQMGAGRPVLFLHGNPTSSYIWRNILPALVDTGQLFAPDLIGMGDSDRLPATPSQPADYSFHTHYRYLCGFIEALGIGEDLALVLHDWGSALGLHWANQHRSSVRAIAYMEALVKPIHWEDWPADVRGFYEDIRSTRGEALVLEQNLFLNHILPSATLTPLSAEDLVEYRRPFTRPEERHPMLAWPRSIPIDGEPADMVELVENYGAWMCDAAMPKLLIKVELGSILTGRQLEFAQCWRNQREVPVTAKHYVQEDAPEAVSSALRDFLAS
jgi:haloalkane dehalogenase